VLESETRVQTHFQRASSKIQKSTGESRTGKVLHELNFERTFGVHAKREMTGKEH